MKNKNLILYIKIERQIDLMPEIKYRITFEISPAPTVLHPPLTENLSCLTITTSFDLIKHKISRTYMHMNKYQLLLKLQGLTRITVSSDIMNCTGAKVIIWFLKRLLPKKGAVNSIFYLENKKDGY